jgi:hypothetical protein
MMNEWVTLPPTMCTDIYTTLFEEEKKRPSYPRHLPIPSRLS